MAGRAALFRRPFATTAEMDREMAARWNEVVQPDDTVWHLGDFALYRDIERVADLLGFAEWLQASGCRQQ